MRTSVQLVVLLVALLGIAVGAAPASAADCVSGTTNWTNSGGGNWRNGSNWSNGVPTANCDARITLAGDYGVTVGGTAMTNGFARSVKVGGASGSQVLVVDSGACGAFDCGFDDKLHVGAGGIDVN